MKNLSGNWIGFYQYNVRSASLRVSFSASLQQAAGGDFFIGQTKDYIIEETEKLDAIVNGRSEKKEVYFTKRYTSFQADAVFYRGVIEANTIKGNWDIEGSDGTLTGTFEMWRIGFLEKEKEQGQELEAALRTVSLSEHNVSKTMPTTSHTARVWKVNSN